MDSQTFTEAADTALEHLASAVESIRDMRILANATEDGPALRDILTELDNIYHSIAIYADEGLGA